MYYAEEDDARRATQISGLVIGALAGTALVLMMPPVRLRRRKTIGDRLGGLSREAGDALRDAVASGRVRLGR